MSEPFLGEIRLMSFQFPPKGWALCNGQLLPINQNQALFSLLGTTYGGNGQTTFALPDLRDRVPVHTGAGISLGQRGGEATHTVSLAELPAHLHPMSGSSSAATTGLAGPSAIPATSQGAAAYGAPADLVAFAGNAVAGVGGSQPHENRQPFLVMSFCIALQGIFPSQN
jgi:microcystin-dependent protein